MRVVNGEIVWEANSISVESKDFRKNGVKRTHGDVFCFATTHNFTNSIGHFSSGLIGERQCKNVEWVNSLLHHVSNAVGEDPGFSGASARYNHGCTIDVFNCYALTIVQFVEVRHVKMIFCFKIRNSMQHRLCLTRHFP